MNTINEEYKFDFDENVFGFINITLFYTKYLQNEIIYKIQFNILNHLNGLNGLNTIYIPFINNILDYQLIDIFELDDVIKNDNQHIIKQLFPEENENEIENDLSKIIYLGDTNDECIINSDQILTKKWLIPYYIQYMELFKTNDFDFFKNEENKDFLLIKDYPLIKDINYHIFLFLLFIKKIIKKQNDTLNNTISHFVNNYKSCHQIQTKFENFNQFNNLDQVINIINEINDSLFK